MIPIDFALGCWRDTRHPLIMDRIPESPGRMRKRAFRESAKDPLLESTATSSKVDLLLPISLDKHPKRRSTEPVLGSAAAEAARQEFLLQSQALTWINELNQRMDYLEQNFQMIRMLLESKNKVRPDGQAVDRAVLDRYCMPLLMKTLSPNRVELNTMSSQISQQVPTVSIRRCTSHIKGWFRKRREEIGNKLAASFLHIYHADLMKTSKGDMLSKLDSGGLDLKNIIDQAGLPIPDFPELREFCKEKLKGTISKHYK